MPWIPDTLNFSGDKPTGMGFFDAVIAAGLANARYSVMSPAPNGDAAWICFFEETTQGDIDAILAIYDTYDPVAEQVAILAAKVRTQRDGLLRSTYDPGILMALRALRRATTPEEISYAEGKIVELDDYAELLLTIPDQPGFPQTVVWPETPTR